MHHSAGEPAPADLQDPAWLPLTGPPRTAVLEASAGTGKTWMIAALAARTVARDDVPIEQIMMVTFGRSATRELRARIFERLRSSEAALAAAIAGRPPTDPLDALLADCSAIELRLRRDRLSRAIADIDLATIDTTHGFSNRMLTHLGLLVDHDPTSRHAEDISQLIDEVIADEYLVRFKDQRDPPRFRELSELAKVAVANPGVPLFPDPDIDHRGEGSGAAVMGQHTALRTAWCRAVREGLAQRLRRSGLHTFDDMVLRVRDALIDPVTGEQAARVLSRRFPIVLVDEFQDTDPDQWQILHAAFHHRSNLVLIGDPKQAIYAFRGADVYAYLDALSVADHMATLPVNYRSDPGVVTGVAELLGGAALGDPRIVVRQVHSSVPKARLRGGRDVAWERPVQLRTTTDGTPLTRTQARSQVLGDVAAQIVAMLADGADIEDSGTTRALRARDVAVLVRTNRFGQDLHAHLRRLGVPAIFPGPTSVFTSASARDWALVITALADPDPRTFSRAALTSLIGYEPARLASAGPAERSELSITFRRLAAVLQERGVAATFEVIADTFDLHRRVLGGADGERVMTDLRHVAQTLHEAQTRQGLSPAGLSSWLTTQIGEARSALNEERTRRLETDQQAVQILTVHRAKGLQFPVVLVPEMSDVYESYDNQPVIGHQQRQGSWVRVLDVGDDPGAEARRVAAAAQENDEALRLLYVAMTRAMSRLVVWWVPVREREGGAVSPLARLLFTPVPTQDPATRFDGRTPDDSVTWGDQIDLGWLAGPCVEVDVIDTAPPPTELPPEASLAGLQARTWDRVIDTTWRRTSYSALTSESHASLSPQAPDSDEPEESDDASADQPAEADEPALGQAAATHAPDQPLLTMPGGTAFGSLIHEILEHCDFTATDLRSHLRSVSAAPVAAARLTGVSQDNVAEGLEQVIESGLGSLTQGRALRSFGPQDRLSELTFDLAMDGSSTVADLARLFNDPVLVPPSDPLTDYGPALAASPAAAASLHGILTGSIDACLRVHQPDGQSSYVVLDYKTNRLPTSHGEPLSTRHYTPAAMTAAMITSHYPLQALLYTVALHRLLQVRLPDYRPDLHLGGVGYLFVRGMAAVPATDQPAMPPGVFTWHPTPALVDAASALLGPDRIGEAR